MLRKQSGPIKSFKKKGFCKRGCDYKGSSYLVGNNIKKDKIMENSSVQAWDGFKTNKWQDEINVRDFIVNNYTPYEGDDSFLAPATERTQKMWKTVAELMKKEMAEKDEVEIKQYSVIYQAIEDVENALKGMLAPKFEEKMQELEKIINELENGEIDLDSSIEKYTKAMKLVSDCEKKLNEVEEKVNKILKENGTLEDFNIEENA